ncbi:hypothetical protein EPI10_019268 [Gossypium australe]|uniref:Uncharacterized protein n=1 Tax=Gossypium australe TaxID=47621 RepID=A0A5B6WAR1_9ROSI|nr:hypothetical protein EPI10_019268 [Gossypium australe]
MLPRTTSRVGSAHAAYFPVKPWVALFVLVAVLAVLVDLQRVDSHVVKSGVKMFIQAETTANVATPGHQRQKQSRMKQGRCRDVDDDDVVTMRRLLGLNQPRFYSLI